MEKLYNFASIDFDGICNSVQQFPEHLLPDTIPEHLVPIPEYNSSYLRKRYDGENWIDVDPSFFISTLTEEKETMLNIDANLEYLICVSELGI